MRDRRLRPIALTNAVFGLSEGVDAASILLFLSRTLHASPATSAWFTVRPRWAACWVR